MKSKIKIRLLQPVTTPKFDLTHNTIYRYICDKSMMAMNASIS